MDPAEFRLEFRHLQRRYVNRASALLVQVCSDVHMFCVVQMYSIQLWIPSQSSLTIIDL